MSHLGHWCRITAARGCVEGRQVPGRSGNVLAHDQLRQIDVLTVGFDLDALDVLDVRRMSERFGLDFQADHLTGNGHFGRQWESGVRWRWCRLPLGAGDQWDFVAFGWDDFVCADHSRLPDGDDPLLMIRRFRFPHQGILVLIRPFGRRWIIIRLWAGPGRWCHRSHNHRRFGNSRSDSRVFVWCLRYRPQDGGRSGRFFYDRWRHWFQNSGFRNCGSRFLLILLQSVQSGW